MVSSVMHRITLLVFLGIVAAAQATPDRCKNKGIFTYGKCPEVWQDFTPDLFAKCAPLFQFGCVMRMSPTSKFSCSLDHSLVADTTICPGDKIVFDGINISDNFKLDYFIDLNAAPVKTDFYLLSDATASMSGAIADVKNKFKEIIAFFNKDARTKDSVAFGVGFFRDEKELTSGFQNLQAISPNQELARAAVNKLRASGGADAPEANLVALNQVATSSAIKWRPGSRRMLVYFGDQPGHEPSCVGGKTLTRFNVADALKKKRITVVAVTFGAKQLDGKTTPFGCGGTGAGAGQAVHITNKTEGAFATAASDSELVTTINTALGNLSRKYNVDESACVSTIKSTFSPINPWFIRPGMSTTVKHTIELKNDRICSSGGSFECTFKFDDFGGKLPGTNIAFVNVKGCPKRR